MASTLGKDVRLLGNTLGAVIRAHGGDELFDHVERMRRGAKRARDARSAGERKRARSQLTREAAELEPHMALEVVRAFTLYFQLVNVAEDVHRTRELRRREIEGGPAAVSESLPAVVAALVRRGAGREELLACLDDIHLAYVFTAHPTEARRRTTERLLAEVRRVLEYRDRRILTPTEEIVQQRRLDATVQSLWEHASERRAKPEVLDEVKAGLWYLRHVLLDVVPRVHRRLQRAVGSEAGRVDPAQLPMTIGFGSWMGSDRDGNPFVTDAVTERTLELQRRIILDRYIADIDGLIDPLAAASYRLPEHPGLARATRRAEAALPELVDPSRQRNPDEPLRRLLSFMRERLVRARTSAAGAYANERELLADLMTLHDVLRCAHADALADDQLLSLITRVRCFGFCLAALDVREDSRVHRRVIAELLGRPDYTTCDDSERRRLIAHLALPDPSAELSDDAHRLLGLFTTLQRLQHRFGSAAIGTYIISMTEGAPDVLDVLALARLHDLEGRLDIVPLLETPDALSRAPDLLTEMLDDPVYRAHLEQRDDLQEIIFGYSDSMKQGGILASRVGIMQAQRQVAAVCQRAGIALRVFHGRGGSVSRGGGPTFRAIGALPRVAFSGRIKLTEQGETRSFHFANPDLAARYVEQTLGAVLAARYEARYAMPASAPDEPQLLARLVRHSQAAYVRLIEDPDLVTYFLEATPFEAIAALHIGSRPVSRKSGALQLGDLRAIPWVFGWSQSRHVLTGWYGVGTALAQVIDEDGGDDALVGLYHHSPFFRDLLDNVQMTLAKADLGIAERYSELCRDSEVGRRIFAILRQEFELTEKLVLRVMGQVALLAGDPVVQRSIRLRNPYVDPLSYLQVAALRAARNASAKTREAWNEVARGAVHGIAAGLRNTG